MQGANKYDDGAGNVRQHYKNDQAQHPGLRALTTDELKFAIYQYYNGGFYWTVSDDGKNWIKNPNTNFTAYGDDAVKIEKQVLGGNPPPGW